MDSEDEDTIFINGVDGTTGDYALPPLSIAAAAAIAQGQRDSPEVKGWLAALVRKQQEGSFGLPEGVDPRDLRSAGWGIVAHPDEDPAVLKALEPLIEHRRAQVAADRFKPSGLAYTTPNHRAWLNELKVASGSVMPERVPYYLLIVGSPERIPFSFSQRLNTEYATGRLHLPTPEDYKAYVESVIRYETASGKTSQAEVLYYAPRHEFDAATQRSADQLVRPLAGLDAKGQPTGEGHAERSKGMRSRAFWGPAATKAALTEALHSPLGGLPPALLFSASHGVLFPKGHALQQASQGALLTQDWPRTGEIGPAHYFAAQDLRPDARIGGLIAFFFACYGGATPTHDRFIPPSEGTLREIAPQAFHARLPTAMLAHRAGGALAVIGHIERTWTSSIIARKAGAQHQPFTNAIDRILAGHPVGYALRDFYDRYAETSAAITQRQEDKLYGQTVPDIEFTRLWLERNDAEGYVLLGDPAAHLRPELLAKP